MCQNQKMKVAYLSQTALSDVDISYIKEAQKVLDITYYIQASPSQRQKAALNLKELPERFGIIPGDCVEELKKFAAIIDLNKVFVINYTAKSNHSIESIVESYYVYKELKKNNYDVIHLTWPPSYSDLFIYRLRKKIVLTVHDPFSHSSQAGGIREYERKRAFSKIDNFILLNSAQTEAFIHAYGLDIPSKHIYNSRLSIYDYLNIHKNCILPINYNQVLFFGQIFAHKGVDYLLEAMTKVHVICPEAKLIVAGGGQYWFEIDAYKKLDYIDIQNRYIPDSELVQLVSSSAFVVVPYIDATQSGVVMTAYTFNKPCIATKVGALPEMVLNGYNGVLIEPKDSCGLANAIVELLQNPQLIDKFSNQIENDYKNGKMSWLAIAKQHNVIYKNVMNCNN